MSELPIPEFSVLFNGIELNQWLDVYDVNRNVGHNRVSTLTKIGRLDGKLFEYNSADEGTVTVSATMLDNLIQNRRELAAALYSEEPVQLIFGDEPDKYYLATVEGASSMTETNAFGDLTIKFVVPDDLVHAVATRSFDFNDDGLAQVVNTGTHATPLDIHATFTSDANSIAVVTTDDIVQLGTSIPDEGSDVVPSTKVMYDKMGSATSKYWSANTGKVRWRADSGDNTSKIAGALKWYTEAVSASSFGTFTAVNGHAYWHGPSLTRQLTTPLDNYEAYHRISFKPQGTSKQIASCTGLIEINYSDADGNFVMGFEMKDNNNKANTITYSYFVGDVCMYTGTLPKSITTKNGGFYGSVLMKKVGDTFTFRMARLDGNTKKETWASSTKTFTNNTVAMLQSSILNQWMAVWGSDRTMDLQLTETRITQYNTTDDSLIPLTFYEGDELFVEAETNRVYINGVRNDAYRVMGSSGLLQVQPGTTDVYAVSDGTFTGYVEEREQFV